ncbi:MAG TPA: CehA/McbA family metallohydrolase [Pirellulales bacterium]|nr:CehA/McbA family metallohydrolase [Pirellulales bacterium]
MPKRTVFCFALAAFFGLGATALAAGGGELTLTVVDAQTGQPLACRMHLRNEKNRPQRAAKTLFYHDHFVFHGTVKIKLPRGTYRFVIERGPEYLDGNGYFVIDNQAKDDKTVELRRACDMADEGWWSGDLHVHRSPKDIELLMLAEDLHLAGVLAWTNSKNDWTRQMAEQPVRTFDGNRCYTFAGEDRPPGGTLLYFNLPEPLSVAGNEASEAAALDALFAARQVESSWIDISSTTALDLPLWLGAGRVDSIGVCHDQMLRPETTDGARGKPLKPRRPPGVLGEGNRTQELYYHVLNCGLRIPPSAGSGSGEATNPVGYNRVYVWLGQEPFDYARWWQEFRQGRVVATNGPLVRPVANGKPPGEVFEAAAGETVSLDVAVNVTVRETISYFELVKNGRVAASVRYEELAKTGHFPPLEFDESGWCLVRAVTDLAETYRFATSAPWYVEIGDAPRRVSKQSAQFFLDRLAERRQQLEADGKPPAALSEALDRAKAFWKDVLAKSNVP